MTGERCEKCGALMSDHASPRQHEWEALADEVAHDVVAAPSDDADEQQTSDAFRRVVACYAAAYTALAAGGDRAAAVAAAEAWLREHP